MSRPLSSDIVLLSSIPEIADIIKKTSSLYEESTYSIALKKFGPAHSADGETAQFKIPEVLYGFANCLYQNDGNYRSDDVETGSCLYAGKEY